VGPAISVILQNGAALIRKLKLNNYFGHADMSGVAKGIYVAMNKTTGEQMKFLVH
jgi:hypothetical protein